AESHVKDAGRDAISWRTGARVPLRGCRDDCVEVRRNQEEERLLRLHDYYNHEAESHSRTRPLPGSGPGLSRCPCRGALRPALPRAAPAGPSPRPAERTGPAGGTVRRLGWLRLCARGRCRLADLRSVHRPRPDGRPIGPDHAGRRRRADETSTAREPTWNVSTATDPRPNPSCKATPT